MTTRLTFTGNDAWTSPPTPFAGLLRTYRTDRHISQSRLAERAGFDHSYVSRLESGARTPSREAIELLARAMRLDAAQLDKLLAAAGFMPGDVASLLSQEPELSDILGLLRNEAIESAYRDAVRSVLRSLAEQARIVSAMDRSAARGGTS